MLKTVDEALDKLTEVTGGELPDPSLRNRTEWYILMMSHSAVSGKKWGEMSRAMDQVRNRHKFRQSLNPSTEKSKHNANPHGV